MMKISMKKGSCDEFLVLATLLCIFETKLHIMPILCQQETAEGQVKKDGEYPHQFDHCKEHNGRSHLLSSFFE
jgi:hypothetical protein